MKTYRCLLKDNFYENADTAADNWTEDANGVQILVVTNKFQFTAGGGVICRAHWTRLVDQQHALWYQFQIKQYNAVTVAGYNAGIYFYSSAVAGAHYGNGYLVVVEEDTGTIYLRIYRVAANVLTKLNEAAITFALNTEYLIEVYYDPGTGVITAYQDGVQKVTTTDGTPWATGSYVALRCQNFNVQFNKVRCRRPADSPTMLELPHVIQVASGGVSTWKAMTEMSGAGTCEWKVGDGIECELYDGSSYVEDFDGVVSEVKLSTRTGTATISGTDWRGQAISCEAIYAGGAKNVGNIMIDIITNNLTVLREGGVVATGDGAVARTLRGRYVYEQLQALCIEVDYSMWQTFWRKFNLTNSYPASGITINSDTDPVVDSEWVEDGYELINAINVYRTGGVVYTDSDSTSQGLYYKRGRTVIDPTIPDLNHATAYATNLISRTSMLAKVCDIWVAGEYHELMVGDAVTLTIEELNLDGTSALVLEKEYGPDVPGFRFRCVIGTQEKERRDYHGTMAKTDSKAQCGMAFHL